MALRHSGIGAGEPSMRQAWIHENDKLVHHLKQRNESISGVGAPSDCIDLRVKSVKDSPRLGQ